MPAFDTLAYARKLQEGGLDQKAADAAADVIKEHVVDDLVTDDLVTKEYLQLALDNVTLRLTVRFGGMIALGILAARIKLT